MNETERLAHYDRDYFLGRNCPEQNSYRLGILRPGDMGAAMCYALGYKDYGNVCYALDIPEDNCRFLPDITMREQVNNILHFDIRTPSKVLEIGFGRGELGIAFYMALVNYMGCDPAPMAREIAKETCRKFHLPDSTAEVWYYYASFLDAVRFADSWIDTIICCESLEHIPLDQIHDGMPYVKKLLTETHGLFIATNWIDFWPILPDGTGYDHITTVDDALYDWMASFAKETVFRKGSHLVLQF